MSFADSGESSQVFYKRLDILNFDNKSSNIPSLFMAWFPQNSL